MMKVLEIHRRLIDCFAAQPLPGYPAIVRRYCHSGDSRSPALFSIGDSSMRRGCHPWRLAPAQQTAGVTDRGAAGMTAKAQALN